MLLQLEQECLDIYHRKVEIMRKYKANLLQSLADAEAEMATLVSVLGERASFPRYEKVKGTLKHQKASMFLVLEELRLKKQERIKEFEEVQFQIFCICKEISGDGINTSLERPIVDEADLTFEKLGDLKSHLQELQSEKTIRSQKVNSLVNTIYELSISMSLDFREITNDIHPSLADPLNGLLKSISNETLARLTSKFHSMQQEKEQRQQKLQDLGNSLLELWNLMDTPAEKRKRFEHITNFISSSVDKLTSQGFLAMDVIEQAEDEVERLNALKAKKMKELVFKKQNELEEIYRAVHMDVDSLVARQILINVIDSSNFDLSDLLSSIDDQIANAKEQALSRKEILDKVEKWKHASTEETWLNEYEKDDSRYYAGRGAHKNLQRAEKARILSGKIPTLVESLITKVKTWEMEKGMIFLYHKAPLLRTLEEYVNLRQEKEEEKRKFREQKRLQDQLVAEQEAIFGSKPAIRKPLVQCSSGNTMVGTPIGRQTGIASVYRGLSSGKERRESGKLGNVTPINYVALAKDDPLSRDR